MRTGHRICGRASFWKRWKQFDADIGVTISLQSIEDQVVALAVSAEKNRRLLDGGRQSIAESTYQVLGVAALD